MPKFPTFDATFIQDVTRGAEAASRLLSQAELSTRFVREMSDAAKCADQLSNAAASVGVASSIAEQMNLLGASTASVLDAYRAFGESAGAVRGMVESLQAAHGFIGGAALQSHIEQMQATLSLPAHVSDSIAAMHEHFNANVERIQQILSPFEASLERFATIEKLVAGYESTVLSPSAWEAMTSGFDRLNLSYHTMLRDPVATQLPVVTDLRLPERDVRDHAALVDSFGGDQEDEVVLAAEFVGSVPDRAVERIRALSPRLSEKLASAIRDLGSDDPQAASNACLAIRQVFLGLLRKLAPEANVAPWAKANRDNYRDLFTREGRPSYRARILYLSRFDLPEKSAYSDFLEQNCRSLTSFLKIVNTEVHDESPDEPTLVLTPYRVKHLVVRASGAFAELLICAEAQRAVEKQRN